MPDKRKTEAWLVYVCAFWLIGQFGVYILCGSQTMDHVENTKKGKSGGWTSPNSSPIPIFQNYIINSLSPSHVLIKHKQTDAFP
jgi:hypothetical protein